MASEKLEGYVISIIVDKGFGFIRGPDGQPRFMHARHVIPPSAFDTLKPNQRVRFISADYSGRGARGNGLRAIEVEVIDEGTEV